MHRLVTWIPAFGNIVPAMLVRLQVRNLALLDSAEVDFDTGLNVLTGETGAGKSVLVGALSLLVGERADRNLIRTGEEACWAEACFELVDGKTVNRVLERYGLPPCENNTLIIRRIIRASGASQHFVNDSPVTLNLLRELGDVLVDMHGPHEHQSILRPSCQLELLDAYGHLESLKAQYAERYAEWSQLRQERDELAGLGNGLAERIEMLEWRVRELDEIQPRAGEEEELISEHLRVGSAHEILSTGGRILQELIESDVSAFESLVRVQKELETLVKLLPEAQSWLVEVRELAERVQSLSREIGELVSKAEADPARLEWLERRLADYQRLKRKYGGTVDQVLKVWRESKEELERLRSREERLEELNRKIASVENQLLELGQELSQARQKTAKQLAEAVMRELQDLGFPHGRFEIAFTQHPPEASGLDTVEFLFAPNLGEPLRPLRAIASSGEISRVMLAAKVVLADHDLIPVMVFDEIDANVGGEMGYAVGRKLAALSRRHQVICITHLPQVAIFGQRQFAVRKLVRAQRTVTEVKALEGDERVEEIARMLGGKDLTPLTVKHARELLKTARGRRDY